MKQFANWKNQGLDEYLQVGDVVDEEMADYFLNVLPPAAWTSNLIQIGEPYNHVMGRPTFSTLKKENGVWIYAGHCFCGESTPA